MWNLLRRALFALDPEAAHELAVEQIVRIQQIPVAIRLVERWIGAGAGFSPVNLWGLHFKSPLGLAAGFDKNAEMVPLLRALGFGFVEVGTVTPFPQPGNPRPRLFRYPQSKALINRLGFNNEGASAVAARLLGLEPGSPVFVNIGKNRDVTAAQAPRAYRDCFSAVAPWSDGIVVNLSSPNTPGLRDLQQPQHLASILGELQDERSRTSFRRPGAHPLLIKIAPDLDDEELGGIADVCVKMADGIVATNTTVRRPGTMSGVREIGGLSGEPLMELSTRVLARLRALVGPEYPLVGVGGILGADDVRAKMEAGASLVECYTGFIYGGPGFARAIARDRKLNKESL